jgi:ribonuclease I
VNVEKSKYKVFVLSWSRVLCVTIELPKVISQLENGNADNFTLSLIF